MWSLLTFLQTPSPNHQTLPSCLTSDHYVWVCQWCMPSLVDYSSENMSTHWCCDIEKVRLHAWFSVVESKIMLTEGWRLYILWNTCKNTRSILDELERVCWKKLRMQEDGLLVQLGKLCQHLVMHDYQATISSDQKQKASNDQRVHQLRESPRQKHLCDEEDSMMQQWCIMKMSVNWKKIQSRI